MQQCHKGMHMRQRVARTHARRWGGRAHTLKATVRSTTYSMSTLYARGRAAVDG
jgi:hypothetical protein